MGIFLGSAFVCPKCNTATSLDRVETTIASACSSGSGAAGRELGKTSRPTGKIGICPWGLFSCLAYQFPCWFDLIVYIETQVTGIWIVAYVMGRYPCAIHHWFGMHALILLSVRCVTYRQQSWHYFLADLCYFVNVLLLLWLYVFPHSRTLYIAVFCLSNGPILWAILAWRNSLVFHSLDKITSLFIHIAPPLTLYTLRWLCCDESCAKQPETLVHSVIQESFLGESLNRFYEFFGWSGGPVPASVDTLPAHTEPLNFIHGTIPTHGDNKLPVLESLMFATAFYSLWQGLYALFIMVFQSKKVEQGKRMTSYSWLLDPAKNAKKEGVMYRLCTIDSLGPGKYQLVLFIFWQVRVDSCCFSMPIHNS